VEALARLGKELRRLREKRNLSQDEAAERAGLHPNALSRIESGKQNVTMLTVASLALAYGVTIQALFVPKVKALDPEFRRRSSGR